MEPVFTTAYWNCPSPDSSPLTLYSIVLLAYLACLVSLLFLKVPEKHGRLSVQTYLTLYPCQVFTQMPSSPRALPLTASMFALRPSGSACSPSRVSAVLLICAICFQHLNLTYRAALEEISSEWEMHRLASCVGGREVYPSAQAFLRLGLLSVLVKCCLERTS